MGLFDALRFKVGLDASPVKTGLAEVRTEAVKTGKAMDTALGGSDAAMKKNAQWTQALAQVNRNLAYQVSDVVQSIQAGQKPFRALSVQMSDVGFQIGSAAIASGKMAAVTGVLVPAAAAVATAALAGAAAWAIYTEDARDAEEIGRLQSEVFENLPALQMQARDAALELAHATGQITDEAYAMEAANNRVWKGYRDQVQDTITKLAELRAEQQGVGTQIVDFIESVAPAWTPLGALVRAVTTDSAEYEEQIKAVTDAQQIMNDTVKETAEAERETARRRGEGKGGDGGAARAAEELRRIRDRATLSALDGEDAINAKYDQQIVKVEELAAKSKDYAAAKDAAAALELARAEELDDFRAKEMAATAREQEREEARLAAERERRHKEEMARIADENMAKVEALDMQAEFLGLIGDAFGHAASKADENARALWRVGKGFSIAQTLSTGYSAAVAAIAPPPVGHGPTARGFAAAGLAAGFAALNVARIRGTEMSFHAGGLAPDETRAGGATILRGEMGGVLNTKATERLGEDNVNRLNDGRSMEPTVVVTNPYKHFDRFFTNKAQQRGPVRTAIRQQALLSRYTFGN